MEELYIQKSSDLPNDHLIFRFELHFGYNIEPPYSIWSCNQTIPKAEGSILFKFSSTAIVLRTITPPFFYLLTITITRILITIS